MGSIVSAELPVLTHIFAFIRNESDIVMPIATRIEFCANHDCLATFVSTSYDMTMLEQYNVFGSQFLVFRGLKQLKVVGRRFNYEQRTAVERVDRFDISTYDFCEMLRALYWNTTDWRCESITKELASWLDQDNEFNPVLLQFIVSSYAERRVY